MITFFNDRDPFFSLTFRFDNPRDLALYRYNKPVYNYCSISKNTKYCTVDSRLFTPIPKYSDQSKLSEMRRFHYEHITQSIVNV